MTTLTIEKPVKFNTDNTTLSCLMTSILNEYNDFDIKLMKKYYETKDLDESHFVNI